MASERCQQCGTSHSVDGICPALVGNGNLIRWRLTQLEEVNVADRLTALEASVKTIDDLHHKMDGIRAWLSKIVGGLILALILLVINLAMAGYSGHQQNQRDVRQSHESHGVIDIPE